MLRLESLEVYYGDFLGCSGVTLEVREAQIVAVLGLNGSGKSTVINATSGLVKHRSGDVVFEGRSIGSLPTYRRVALGLAHIPERRRVFPHMTVHDNLLLGAYRSEPRKRRDETIAVCHELFPILADRRGQLAGLLSGGEQQQLSIARGLMSRPKFLMIDEPFLGLSPLKVAELTRTIKEIRERGIAVLLVEQNVRQAMAMSDYGYLLASGRLVAQGTEPELLDSDALRQTYLGLV